MTPVTARLLFLSLLLACPAHLTPETSQGSQVRGQGSLREKPESFKVMVSQGCTTPGSTQEGEEVQLLPGSPLLLTQRILLVAPSGGGACSCQEELGALLGRLEALEREVSGLRESCTGGGGCDSKESRGSGSAAPPDPGPRLCPGDCSDQGRCVGGACVCFHGYGGPDCSRSSCPADCSERGRCVAGECECDPGYTGPGCSLSRCPGDCDNRGRCVGGRCECLAGFTGPACSVCVDGMTGPRCDQALSEVNAVISESTETSVTLNWTPPPVQYQTYHITFTSKKDSEQQVVVQVEGVADHHAQTGLASGQEYTATIAGEIDGKTGASKVLRFSTLTSSPTKLRVVKTSTSSAVVQWEPAQGKIDRYRLTVSPNDGAGKAQEITLPPERDSAHLEHLEAGRLYDIILRAESAVGQSSAAVTQVTPGEKVPRGSLGTVHMQVTPTAQGNGDLLSNPAVVSTGSQQNSSSTTTARTKQNSSSTMTARTYQNSSSTTTARTKQNSSSTMTDRTKQNSSSTMTARTKQNSSSTTTDRNKPFKLNFQNRLQSKPGERLVLARRPSGLGWFGVNGTRVGPGRRRPDSGPLKKSPVGAMKKEPMMRLEASPGPPVEGDATPESHSSRSSSAGDQRDKWPTRLFSVAKPLATDSGRSSEESTITPGSNVDPEVAMVPQGSQTGSGEPPDRTSHNGSTHINEKKCLNKVKVTHIKLPGHTEPGAGSGRADEVVVGCGTPGGVGTPGAGANPAPEDQDSSNRFHQLLTDTFNSLNIKTFSVHLSKTSDISHNADSVRDQILAGLMPVASPASSPPPSSPSSPSPSSPSSSSSLDGENERRLETVRDGGLTTDEASARQQRQPPALPRQLARNGRFQRRPNLATFRNGTRFSLRQAPALNRNPGKEPSQAPSSSSTSEDPSSPGRTLNEDKNGAVMKLLTNQDQSTSWREGRELLVRRYPSRNVNTNSRAFRSRTHPRLRWPKLPIQHMNRETEENHQASNILPPSMATSAPSHGPDGDQGSEPGEAGGRSNTDGLAIAELDQNASELAAPALKPQPNSGRYTRRLVAKLGPVQNRARPNLKPGRLLRRPVPPRRPNGDIDVIADQIQITQSVEPEISGQSKKQDPLHNPAHIMSTVQPENPGPTEDILRSRLATKDNRLGSNHNQTKSRQTVQSGSHVYPLRFETSQSGSRVSTDGFQPEETGNAISDSHPDRDFHTDRMDSGKSTPPQVPLNGSGPLGHRAFATTTATHKRAHLTGRIQSEQSPTQGRKMVGQQQSQGSGTSHSGVTGATDTEIGTHTRQESDVPLSGPPGEALGEALDYVGVRNRTSDGFTLVWAVSEGKYSSFVVTRRKGVGNTKELQWEEEPPEEGMRHGGAILTGSDTPFTTALPGSDRSFLFEKLAPQTPFTVTLLGRGRGLLSRLHKLVISTVSAGEGEEEGPQNLQVGQVTPRTALLSWEQPASAATASYTLTYQAEGEEPKEVTLDATTTNHTLRRLRPGASYTATLQGERATPPLSTHFTTGHLRFPFPADCSEELLNGEGESGESGESGEVEVFPGGGPGDPLTVYCDMETDGGGWTVFQRRVDGSVDFFRGWKDYTRGFGDQRGEFWLGLDSLQKLTSGAQMSLRVDLRAAAGEEAFAHYSSFQVAEDNYRLSVAGYSGTAGDSLTYHNHRLFSTRDRDPATSLTRCAVSYGGGWWYRNCHQANLNGRYGNTDRHQGVIWSSWKGKEFSIPFTEMKMRPTAFTPPPPPPTHLERERERERET